MLLMMMIMRMSILLLQEWSLYLISTVLHLSQFILLLSINKHLANID
jgi:hypothetical protein